MSLIKRFELDKRLKWFFTVFIFLILPIPNHKTLKAFLSENPNLRNFDFLLRVKNVQK